MHFRPRETTVHFCVPACGAHEPKRYLAGVMLWHNTLACSGLVNIEYTHRFAFGRWGYNNEVMDKAEALKALFDELAADPDLPLPESNLVFGEGNIDCEVMFIGEAPGFHENEQKRPFVGRGGQLLNRNIEKIGWKREGVYITNIVKRRPPDNRDPLPEEIAAYKPYLTRQIEIINPLVVVPLGRFSMNYFLPDAKITRDQGKVFRLGNRFIVPMFHPAAALRATGVLEAFEETFRKLPRIVAQCKKALLEGVAEERAVPEKQGTKKPAQDRLF